MAPETVHESAEVVGTMTSVLRAMFLAVASAVLMLVVGLAIGLVVTYWSHIVDYALIVVGLGGIAALTCWSD